MTSLLLVASTSITIFVPPSNNIESENNDVKNVLASENIEKGKDRKSVV